MNRRTLHDAVCAVLVMMYASATAQIDVRAALQNPRAAPAAPILDPKHLPPTPGSAPQYPYRPDSSGQALPAVKDDDEPDEDTQHLREMWANRRSPEELRAMMNAALMLPQERGSLPEKSGPSRNNPDPAFWSQIGFGVTNPDGLHHTSGRQRGASCHE